MRSKFFKRLVLLPTVGVSAAVGGSILIYPELREDYSQILLGAKRLARVSWAGFNVVRVYKGASEFTPDIHRQAATYLKDAFINNGGVYIKFGQVMGNMDYLLPPQYLQVFEPLMQQAPKSSYETVCEVFERSTGRKISDVFSDFSKKPIASASLAQVHLGTLRETGEKVAVKIQHSWIKQQAPGDIRVAQLCVDMGRYLFNDFEYQWLADAFKDNVPLELDFRLEADNARRCSEMFQDDEQVHVPWVNEKYSSEEVIVMEYVEGPNIADVSGIEKLGVDLEEVASLLSECFAQMTFVHGFVHSDPHAGNIFVNKCANGKPQLILLDHGIYQELSEDTRYNWARLWKGLILQRRELIFDAAEKLGAPHPEVFVGMVTSRPYEEVLEKSTFDKSRFQGSGDHDDQEKIRAHIVKYHKEITTCLEQADRQLILLFKTQDFIRALDRRLGSPANNIYTTAQYCMQSIRHHENEKSGFTLARYKDEVKVSLKMMTLKVVMFVYKVFGWGAPSEI